MKIKPNAEIIDDPIKFREAFLAQINASVIDDKYMSILNIFLYYIWQGISKTRKAMIQDKVQMDLGILCVATFTSFLPVIQNLRLGFPTDAMILLRALMERIALLGYLQANPNFIEKYSNEDNKLKSDAMMWAKTSSLENWMKLYSALSNIAHPKLSGTGGYILSKTSSPNLFS